MQTAIFNDNTRKKILFTTFYDLIITGNYKYEGYSKEEQGHVYTQKKSNNGYPIKLIDHRTERRL